MKIKLNPVATAALKNAAAIARTCAVRPEDTAAYIEATAPDSLYIMVKSEQGITYEHTVEASVYEDGSVAVPGKVLHGIIGRFDSPVLSTVRSGKFLRITEDGNHVDLPVFAADILRPERTTGSVLELPADKLLAAVNGVKFAVSPASARARLSNAVLSTMNVTVANGVAVFEGCSMTYGGRVSFPVNSEDCTFSIPQELLSVAVPVLSAQADTETVIYYNSRTVAIEVGGVVLTAPRLAGKFLDTSSVYDVSTYPSEVVINAKELREAVARAMAITSNDEVSCALRLTIPESSAQLNVEYTASLGEISSEVECSVVRANNEVIIGFNPKLLNAVLYGFGDEVRVHYATPTRPILLSTADSGEELASARILCPVRIN